MNAQVSATDRRMPIQYALTWPEYDPRSLAINSRAIPRVHVSIEDSGAVARQQLKAGRGFGGLPIPEMVARTLGADRQSEGKLAADR